jgi:hypothetical protein
MAGPAPFNNQERDHASRGRIMKTDLYIGPLIERNGRFGYDTFSLAEGLRSSFHYQRVGDARYDRRAMVAEVESSAQYDVYVCETLAQFEQLIEAARDAMANPDGMESESSQQRSEPYPPREC